MKDRSYDIDTGPWVRFQCHGAERKRYRCNHSQS